MKYRDEPMKPKEHWLFWSGLILGLALYQTVDTYLLRSPQASVLGASSHSTNEPVALQSTPRAGNVPEYTQVDFSRFEMDFKGWRSFEPTAAPGDVTEDSPDQGSPMGSR